MAKIENPRVRKRKDGVAPKGELPQSGNSPTLTTSKPGGILYPTIVLFGPPKTGKTTGAVSGEGTKLLIETEPEGDAPLVGRDDVEVVYPKDGKELSGIVTALHGGAVSDYDRVVLDSATFAFEIAGRKDVAKVAAAGKDTRNVYGRVGAAIQQIIHDIVALPVPVVITTQLRTAFQDEDDEDAPTVEEGNYPFTLGVTPMVYKVLAPAASAIGRTYKKMYRDAQGNKKIRFLVSFEDYGRSPAGSRVPVPETVEDLDLDKLIAAMKGETE